MPQRGDLDLSKCFHALSDETRRNILRLLEVQESCVKDIGGHFVLSQPTISRHLAVLEQAKLVTRRREGQFVFYRLRGRNLAHFIERFMGDFKHSQDEAPRQEDTALMRGAN
jgi:DNA-binding transcriptional ArsR family regulator